MYKSREKVRHRMEVHVCGICFKHDPRRVLITKRSAKKELYPGMLECCGGQLEPGESFQEGVIRHYREELGIEVSVPKYRGGVFSTYVIQNGKEGVIPGIRFLCSYESGDLLEPTEWTYDWAQWFTFEELQPLPGADFVPGLRRLIHSSFQVVVPSWY